ALAVGGGYVMEAVNTTVRVWDTSGNVLQTQNLGAFFNQPDNSGGDPYIVYDDLVNRWYVLALNSSLSGVLLAVSNDAAALHGFSQQYFLNLGKFIDFPKMGFNADAVVITGNDFTDPGTPLQGISIDKSALLAGSLVDYTWQRGGYPDHFRAEVPAWMHGAT